MKGLNLRSVRIWGVLGLLLALAVVTFGSTVTITGRVGELQIFPEGDLVCVLKDDGTFNQVKVELWEVWPGSFVLIATTHTNYLGEFRLTFGRSLQDIKERREKDVFIRLEKTGCKPTATFVYRIMPEVTSLSLGTVPIVTNRWWWFILQVCFSSGIPWPRNAIIAVATPSGWNWGRKTEPYTQGLIEATAIGIPWRIVFPVLPHGTRAYWTFLRPDFFKPEPFPDSQALFIFPWDTDRAIWTISVLRWGGIAIGPVCTPVAAPKGPDIVVTVGIIPCRPQTFPAK